MTDTITVRGFAGTDPQLRNPESGHRVATFRLGSTPRWRDPQSGEWVSGTTNWYTVAAFGRLAENAAHSIRKGDPVVVVGRPKVRSWENDAGATGTDVEVSAQSVAHDLNYGHTRFAKVAGSEAPAASADQSDTTAGNPRDADAATEPDSAESQSQTEQSDSDDRWPVEGSLSAAA